MIHMMLPRQDAHMFGNYLEKQGEAVARFARILPFEEVVEADALSAGRYVFAGLDRLGPAATAFFSEVYAQLHKGLGREPLNHPGRTLRRYELLQALHADGLNQFRAKGAWEDLSDLRYPVFVRDRSKDGGVPHLLHSLRDVQRTIGRRLMEGRDLSELLVVEFLDTSDADGFYRKYAALIVDRHVVPFAMDYGRHWVTRRHSAEYTRESVLEERRFMTENPHRAQLERIVHLSNTGYGRIDYAVLDGRVQVWEINTLPLIGPAHGVAPVPPKMKALRQRRTELVWEGFESAWRAVERDAPSGPTVPIQVDETLRARARAELETRVPPTYPGRERLVLLRALLRPFKPLAMPVAERFVMPMMARAARRSAASRSDGSNGSDGSDGSDGR